MSAYIHPPGIVNPSPWEQALAATKQDTGWDYSPGGTMSVDYATPGGAAAASSNGFGYSYSNPGQGFNPWGLYDDNGPYKGGDGVGLYNVNADTKKGWGPNGQGEFDRDRVLRMALDQAKAEGWDPGAAENSARFQSAVLNNIARLHRDYDNTPGLGAQAWASSAFAGYDKLAGGGATQQGGTRGGDGQGTGWNGQEYRPGDKMSIDYTGTGQGAQAQGGSTVDPSAGMNSVADAGKKAAANALQSGLFNTKTGQTTTSVPGLGTMGGDPLYNYGLALNGTAQDRARLIGEANGRSSPAHGRLAEYATNLYANALKAYLMISQLGGGGAAGANPQTGVGDMNSFLAAMQGGGGGIIPLLQGGISKGLGGNLGQDPETQEQAYRAAIALRSLYSGGLASDVAGQNLDDAMWQQGASVDRNPLGGGQSLLDILNQNNSPYKANLSQYLGLR